MEPSRSIQHDRCFRVELHSGYVPTLIEYSQQIIMLPTNSILATLAARHPLGDLGVQQQSHREQSIKATFERREPFPAWSAIDEAKKKAGSFAQEAAREYDVASKKAQEKAGKIEPWTPKYYAACTFGGMLACVRDTISRT